MRRPTAEILKRLFRYEPETGNFVRLITTAANAQAGDVAGFGDGGFGYRSIYVQGRSFRAHILAWVYMTGEWPTTHIDHRNGDPSDNRWENLRLATRSQNIANSKTRKDNSTGAKGVSFHGNKYRVRVGNGGKHHVGTFDTLDAARSAYEAAAKKIYGQFARAK